MERAELFRAIEDSCHMDVRPLADRVLEALGACRTPAQKDEEEKSQKPSLKTTAREQESENLFYIEKSGTPIHITSERDACTYRWTIENVEQLDKFAERYQEQKETSAVVKSVRQLIKTAKKADCPYRNGQDNAEKLAKYVHEKILKKHIKNIITVCYRAVTLEGKESGFYAELTKTVNAYLQKLGVYTIMAQIGEPYDNAIYYYELICDTKGGSIAKPIITKIEWPAYIIEYTDEDGELQSYCMQGQCISEREEDNELS